MASSCCLTEDCRSAYKQAKKKIIWLRQSLELAPGVRESDSSASQAGRAALRDPHAQQWDALTRHIKRLSLGFTAADTTLF